MRVVFRCFSRNPYKILKIEPNSSEETIKQEYFKLVKEYHPDMQNGSNVKFIQEMFKVINEAYNQLKDKGIDSNKQEEEEVEEADTLIKNKWEGFYYEEATYIPPKKKKISIIEGFSIT